MIVTCPECKTQYRLDPALLGAEGRLVACSACRHTWHQKHVEEKNIEQVLQDANAAEEPQAALPAAASFDTVLKETAAGIAPASTIPDAVKPLAGGFMTQPPPAPGPVYRVMSMGAAQFGGLVFLACCFVTLIALFVARGPVLRAWPAAALLYKSMGFDVKAPGEGFRLSSLVAENRVDKAGRTLAIEAQLTNLTQEPMDYPALRVILSSPYGAPLKEWVLDNEKAPPLASGESMTIKSELKDPPEGGTDIDIKVIER